MLKSTDPLSFLLLSAGLAVGKEGHLESSGKNATSAACCLDPGGQVAFLCGTSLFASVKWVGKNTNLMGHCSA